MNACHIGIGAQISWELLLITERTCHREAISTCQGPIALEFAWAEGKGSENVLEWSDDHHIDMRGCRVSNKSYG
jgi:hypothetical protein